MDRHQGLYDEVIYGLYGTRTTFALAEAVSELEGGCNTVITSSGTSAIALALTAFVAGGDHLIVADCVYGPTRKFLNDVLARFGVEVEDFRQEIGAEIDRTSVVSGTRLAVRVDPGGRRPRQPTH